MTPNADFKTRFARAEAALDERGQSHVLRFWDRLDPGERDELLADIESIPWELVDGLIDSHVLAKPQWRVPENLAPATVHPQPPTPEQESLYEQARSAGRGLIAAGKVAAFTVAGGQGTRLGYDGPKGAVAVTPVGDRTLFELFAGAVKAARLKYGATIPWYVMTSRVNHEQTQAFMHDHDFFGLPEADVCLFSQGMLPAFDLGGKLMLEAPHRLALAPDGHGGSLKALVVSGALEDMRSRGVEIVSYFQVDNPLVKPFDPLFVGLHRVTGSQMSTKVTAKADDHERVGNVCLHDGQVMVVEYSDFPEACAVARNEDGRRRFDAGNLAMHLLDVDFVDRVIDRSFQLPFRRAEKAVAHVDETGSVVPPTGPNAVKLETFVFDVLPLAKRPLVLAVERAEEFSPVKNATGVDSLESSQRDQNERACRWLAAADVAIPRKPDGTPDVTVTIAPTFALDADDVVAKASRLSPLMPGASVFLE